MLTQDLKTLTPQERTAYYTAVCASLNPCTVPLAYLNLNGRLVLYATRQCADQLRKLHNVNLTIKSRELMGDCFVVVAQASLPNGRQDESIGVVPIENLRGESGANAMMKCETKSTRRATLSICGLGILDETEVSSIRDASPASIDPATGEALSAEPPLANARSREALEEFSGHDR